MPIFAKLEICRDATPRSAAVNMAIDEALLETAKVPSIRFYRWNSPALSFGYFGKFADVANYAPRRNLVRRWTGGGIVFHGDDLTYSIVIPANDPAFRESSMLIYEKIHCALCSALLANGERAELAPVAGVVDAGAAIIDRGYSCFACCIKEAYNSPQDGSASPRRPEMSILEMVSRNGLPRSCRKDAMKNR